MRDDKPMDFDGLVKYYKHHAAKGNYINPQTVINELYKIAKEKYDLDQDDDLMEDRVDIAQETGFLFGDLLTRGSK